MPPPVIGSAPTPLDIATVEAMILANAWASAAQIERVKPLARDGRQLMRALVDQRIAPPDALAQFDLLIHLQAQLTNFTVLRKLGAGGMGTVYLARHHESGNEVAIKVISARLAGDSEFLSRFHRETQVLVGLSHPNLANVIASGSTGQTHWLAIDYINGPSLAALLKEHRALPEEYVLRLMIQVADCLAYVNSKAGLVHRDVKPENILINRMTEATPSDSFPPDDQAKLIDFGLVKAANDDEHLTQTGMTIGTPLYMSPEQVRGDRLDCRSDIYGLGATMFHLLSGSPPFKGTSPGAIMSAHLTDPVPDPGSLVPSLSEATRRLVMTSMAKAVEQRFLGFDGFLKACQDALAGMAAKAGGTIKLLRKPLILQKKSMPASAAANAANAATGKSPEQRITESFRRNKASDTDRIADTAARINQKAADIAAERKPDTTSRALKPGTQRAVIVSKDSSDEDSGTSVAAAAPAIATAALVQAHTDRLQRRKELPKPALPTPPDLSQSAAFAEQPSASGAGVLPWLILGCALAVAGGFCVWYFTRT